MTPSPRLYVSIYLGVPENDLGFTDRFQVEGDAELVEAFRSWWSESGMADHAAERNKRGDSFMLMDHGEGGMVGGDIYPLESYLDWRESLAPGPVAEEPALLVAA